MTGRNSPGRANDEVRPESDLSQVLAHGPALSFAYGRVWGGLLMLAAILKASRGPLGFAAAATVAGGILLRFWCG
ncbi:MAG: hypothetical protein ABW175_10735 [Bradyrhizobium sp.]